MRGLAIAAALGGNGGTDAAWAQRADMRPPAGVAVPALPAPASQPAAPELPAVDEQFLQTQRQQRDQAQAAYPNLPDGGPVPLDRIATLADDGTGMLTLTPGPLAGPLYQRFTAGGIPAVWQFTRTTPAMQTVVRPDGTVGPLVVSTATLTRVDLAAADDAAFWSVRVSHQPATGYMSVYGQSVKGTTMLTLYPARRNAAAAARPGAAQAFGNLRAVNLTATEWRPIAAAGGVIGPVGGPLFVGARARTVVTYRAAADSLPDLRADRVAEFRRYVVPLLSPVSDLGWLTPGPSDVYAAFPSIPADPAVAERVAALLPDLDAEAADVRDAAAEQLTALGPAGALAALRVDPATLSVGQRGELGRLVAAHRRRDLSPAAARRDPGFLLDALEYPDPAVRAAAKAALVKVVGEPLVFDPSLAAQPLGLAADAVRLRVTALLAAGADPATRPATRPAP